MVSVECVKIDEKNKICVCVHVDKLRDNCCKVFHYLCHTYLHVILTNVSSSILLTY